MCRTKATPQAEVMDDYFMLCYHFVLFSFPNDFVTKLYVLCCEI
ncbi:hypothetical protein Lalb_Chr15g0090541 [Lupinus albus]|uniref:Uncharacterized protein n=1 Tax=Lupinus albus TaxID=3870 RepID=A0A6A4PBL0_LUPAL|nr:hypothetical protein Lalb_Chr15g0090541 [Lupinus albus]